MPPIICQATWFHLCVQIPPTFLFYCKSPSYKLLLITSTCQFIECFLDVHIDKTLVKKACHISLAWSTFSKLYPTLILKLIFKICSEALYVIDSHPVQLSFTFPLLHIHRFFFFRWHNSLLNKFTNPMPPEPNLGSWEKKISQFPQF